MTAANNEEVPGMSLLNKAVSLALPAVPKPIVGFFSKRYIAGSTRDEAFRVAVGDRIAQLLFLPLTKVDLAATDELDQTERGPRGFGSSGRGERA